MRPKYYWTQLLVRSDGLILRGNHDVYTRTKGITICIGGMGLLVASDQISNGNNSQAKNMVLGDIFMIVGATLYGFSGLTV